MRTRALVQDAVRDLFEREGAGALTHQRVAERAGVSRATVYRHWPQPVDLVVEALGVADQPGSAFGLVPGAPGEGTPCGGGLLPALLTVRDDDDAADPCRRSGSPRRVTEPEPRSEGCTRKLATEITKLVIATSVS